VAITYDSSLSSDARARFADAVSRQRLPLERLNMAITVRAVD